MDKSVKPKVPKGWKAYWSNRKEQWYYSNKGTGEVVWSPPEGTVTEPDVSKLDEILDEKPKRKTRSKKKVESDKEEEEEEKPKRKTRSKKKGEDDEPDKEKPKRKTRSKKKVESDKEEEEKPKRKTRSKKKVEEKDTSKPKRSKKKVEPESSDEESEGEDEPVMENPKDTSKPKDTHNPKRVKKEKARDLPSYDLPSAEDIVASLNKVKGRDTSSDDGDSAEDSTKDADIVPAFDPTLNGTTPPTTPPRASNPSPMFDPALAFDPSMNGPSSFMNLPSHQTQPSNSMDAHYSAIAQSEGTKTRQEQEDSPCYRFRNLSNFIKTVGLYASCQVWGDGAELKVVDLACGRGGDVHKWKRITQKKRQKLIKFYGLDVARGAIAHATEHRSRVLPSSTDKVWLAEDLERPDLVDTLIGNGTLEPESLHVASMQFALHYFFKSEASLQALFHFVSRSLMDGGIFVCTYADGNTISRMCREKRWEEAQKSGFDPPSVRVENDLFSIEMATRVLKDIEHSPIPFGHGYRFTLSNAVRGMREFLVVDTVLTQIAESFGMRTILEENFQPFTKDVMRQERHQETMRYMKVFGQQRELQPSEWEATSLYKIRIFVKDVTRHKAPQARNFISSYLF